MREIRFSGTLKTKTLLTTHKTDHYTPPLNLLNIAIYIFTFVFLKTHKKTDLNFHAFEESIS